MLANEGRVEVPGNRSCTGQWAHGRTQQIRCADGNVSLAFWRHEFAVNEELPN